MRTSSCISFAMKRKTPFLDGALKIEIEDALKSGPCIRCPAVMGPSSLGQPHAGLGIA